MNQRYYGGTDFGTNPAPGHVAEDRVGAYWRTLTTSTITVCRRAEDTYAEQVRIRIFYHYADWDSGWVSLSQDEALTLTHNLGGEADDYLVDMQYQSSGVDGINARYYGGADFGVNPAPGHLVNGRVGSYWRSLTSLTIAVYRRPEDTYGDQVRIRIWVRPTPTYDSGWVALSQDEARTLLHRLGGNPDDYVVDMQYRSAAAGVNQRYYGGADLGSQPIAGLNENDRVGAYWRNLTSDGITVYRRPEDGFADFILVRIWALPGNAYLPVTSRGYAP